MAQDFLKAVDMAIDAVNCDGFDSDWYCDIVSKATQQQFPSLAFQLDTGKVISDHGELASSSSSDKAICPASGRAEEITCTITRPTNLGRHEVCNTRG